MKKNMENNRVGRWYFLMALVLVLTVGLLAGCGKSQEAAPGQQGQAASGQLVVTTYGGKYDEVFMKDVVQPFEAANPGVKIKLAPYTGVAKLAQGGGEQIDIVSLDDFDIVELGNKGLLSELQQKDFSTWEQLYPQTFLKSDGGKVIGLADQFGSWGIAYNPKEMAKPDSWNIFWDPGMKGKVAMMSQWIPDIILTAKARQATYENMDPVWQAFKEVTPNVAQYYSSFSEPEALFGSGTVRAASYFNGRVIAMKEAGKSVDFTIPKEGGVLIRATKGILASSKNQELGRKFVDFCMKPEVQVNFAKDMYYGPTNREAKLDQALVDKGVVYGKEAIDALITPDWNQLLQQRKDWLTKWVEATSR